MRAVEVVLVDAFTSTPFTGNPAAVVPDATGLDEATMRAVAAELARPATAFLRPGANGGDRALRWFSPAGIELTLCGHGTVAAAHVLAARGEAPRGQLVFEAPRHRLAVTLEGSGDLRHRVVRAGLSALGAGEWRPLAVSRGRWDCPQEPSPGGRRPRGRRSRTS